jgi:hypothetical protein
MRFVTLNGNIFDNQFCTSTRPLPPHRIPSRLPFTAISGTFLLKSRERRKAGKMKWQILGVRVILKVRWYKWKRNLDSPA